MKTPAGRDRAEHAMAVTLFDGVAFDSAAAAQAQGLRNQLRAARDRNTNDQTLTAAIVALDDSIVAVAGQGGGGGRGGRGGGRGRGGAAASGPTFASTSGELQALMSLLEDADAEPTTQAVAAVRAALQTQARLAARWNVIRTVAIPALNAKLRAARQNEIVVPK